jgi:AcrR family transcriptional regulator
MLRYPLGMKRQAGRPATPASSGRPYHSPRRQEAATETRRRIRQAARQLFVAQGYAATSIRAVAERAGVAEKTVYLAFPSKPDLLNEVVEVAIAGDDQPIAVAERDWWQQMAAHPDPVGTLERLTDGALAIHLRTADIFEMARGAAAADTHAAELWRAGKRGHRTDCERLADLLLGHPAIASGLDRDGLVATLFTLLGPETYRLVTVELGRTPDQYRAWLLETLRRLTGT